MRRIASAVRRSFPQNPLIPPKHGRPLAQSVAAMCLARPHVRMTQIYDGEKFMIWKLQAPCVTVTSKPAGGMP
jgi:hypothetical protein